MNTKFKLSTLLLLACFQVFAQVPDTSTAEKKARYNIGRIRDNTIRAITPGDFRAAFKAITDLAVNRVPFLSMADLRAGKADTARMVNITDKYRSGVFVYDSADTTTPEDSALTVLVGSKRYKRQFSGSVNAKWFGVIADGTNETGRWQRMIDNPLVKSIYFERTPSPYRIKSIELRSNKTLIFEDGCDVFVFSKLGDGLKLLNIRNISNVVIRGNVTFRDDKSLYPTGTAGQFNGCFNILGGTNITVDGPRIEGFGGDAFYVFSQTYGVPSQNITIRNVTTYNNNRMGVAVISVVGLLVENCKFMNHSGSNPAAGMDLEPNYNVDKLINVRIINCYTANNSGTGILVAPIELRNNKNVIDIVVENHTDDGSLHGAMVGSLNDTLAGQVVFKNCTWKNNKFAGFMSWNWSTMGPKVILDHPTIVNSGSDIFYDKKAALLIYRRTLTGSTNAHVGNIDVINPVIVDNRTATPYQTYAIQVQDDTGNTTVEKVNIIDPIEIGSNYTTPLMTIGMSGIISDQNRQLERALTADFNTSNKWEAKTYHNGGATGMVTETLASSLLVAPQPLEITFDVRTAQVFRIVAQSGIFRPFHDSGTTAGTPIQSNVIGSQLTVRKSSSLTWVITKVVGTWTDQNGVVLFGPQPVSLTNAGTTAPASKSAMNSVYGSYRAGSIVTYDAITGGGRTYRKLSDSSTADWLETIWSTGVSAKLP